MNNKYKIFQSICTCCGKPVPAEYVRRCDNKNSKYINDNRIYLKKTCPEHGTSYILASEDADTFEQWLAYPSVTVPPRVFVTANNKSVIASKGAPAGAVEAKQSSETPNTECPLHCGPCKNHLMTACCVLINVTQRCNQRCPYCFAEADDVCRALSGEKIKLSSSNDDIFSSHREQHFNHSEKGRADRYDGIEAIRQNKDPSLTTIERWLDRLIELGEERKFNIQLNGGEPTVRDDLPDIIRMCRDKGFEYIQLNTNGRKLAEDPSYTKTLKAAGLSTVFLQFDGVDDDVYIALRGEPLLEIKKAAIKNCAAAGLPVTLVPTVLKSINLEQVGAIIDFMLENISVIKGVHFQPASFFGRKPDERNAEGDYDERVTMFSIMNEIENQMDGRIKKSDLSPITTGHPLCCFCAAFLKENDGVLHPLTSGGACCDKEARTEDSSACYEVKTRGKETHYTPEVDSLDVIRRDRDFVLNKWDVAEPAEASCDCTCSETSLRGTEETKQSSDSITQCDCNTSMSFDDAIAMFKNNTFTISGMAFMDETNLDAERLRRCRVQVFSEDERLIPFCGYYSMYQNTSK